jgi:glycosyltransferase involved in cell wall biosynthesis
MGHHVGVICDSGTGGDTAKRQLERLAPWCGLGIMRVRMGRSLGPGDIVTMAKIGRHVARLSPQIIHGHGAKGGAYARLLPRAKGRAVLYTPHGGTLHYNWKSPAGALFLSLERYLMTRSDGILFESRFGESAYAQKIGAPQCPTRVTPNGLSQADFAPLRAGEPKYDAVFVGELRTLKGVSTLIEAVARISRDRPFRLGIAGTGPDEWRFRAHAAARGIETIVDFLGYQPAREMFAQTRTIIVPSLAESLPYVVLEAIASGRPVIATRVGGIPEIFGPQADALLPPGDAKALAQAIRAALETPELTKPCCAALQDRARKLFSASRMARDVTRFYADLKETAAAYAEPVTEPVKLPETTAV